MVGRWIRTDGSGGFSLLEAESASAIYEAAAMWADLLEMEMTPVVVDAEAAPVLQKFSRNTC
jgi:hypothetical protein